LPGVAAFAASHWDFTNVRRVIGIE